jgi:hypothetical protein
VSVERDVFFFFFFVGDEGSAGEGEVAEHDAPFSFFGSCYYSEKISSIDDYGGLEVLREIFQCASCATQGLGRFLIFCLCFKP